MAFILGAKPKIINTPALTPNPQKGKLYSRFAKGERDE
jgi:hypothetical protein